MIRDPYCPLFKKVGNDATTKGKLFYLCNVKPNKDYIMKKISIDKLLHCMVAFILAIVFALLFKWFKFSPIDAAGLAWIATFIVGMGKEVYDEVTKKNSESKDWLADAVGMTIGALCAMLLTL